MGKTEESRQDSEISEPEDRDDDQSAVMEATPDKSDRRELSSKETTSRVVTDIEAENSEENSEEISDKESEESVQSESEEETESRIKEDMEAIVS